MNNISVVIWEWLNEYGRWRPYDPPVVHFIEKHYGYSGLLYPGDVDPGLSCYVLDTVKMIQTRQGTGVSRQIRRKIYDSSSAVAKGISWEWSGDFVGQWNVFDFDIANALETAYQRAVQVLDLSLIDSRVPYTVNLSQMKQTRNETGRQRQVRRLPGTVLYPQTNSVLTSSAIASGKSLNTQLPATSTDIPGKRKSGGGRKMTRARVGAAVKSKGSGDSSNAVGSTVQNTPTASSSSSTGIMTNSTSMPYLSGALPKNTAKRLCSAVTGFTNMLMSPVVPIRLHPTIPRSQTFPQSRSLFNLKFPSGGSTSKDDKPIEIEIAADFGKCSTDVLKSYSTTIDIPPKDEDCCICCDSLTADSGYEDNATENSGALQLNKCLHMFHRSCLTAMYDSGTKDGSLQCPTCKEIYGEKFGNCPPGRMEVQTIPNRLPSENCATIMIQYYISPGVQGPEHPHPGQPYSAKGFPRSCFLPDSEKGKRVLKLLRKAWDRRLTFTVGSSVTTGTCDTVVWNEIHHKTEFGSNHTGHGYPDPNYLDNVLMELSIHGITDSDSETT